MSRPVPVPPRLSLPDEEDGDGFQEALPEGISALGRVFPLSPSVRAKWERAPPRRRSSTGDGAALEALQQKLTLAEARREDFRRWLGGKRAAREPWHSRAARAEALRGQRAEAAAQRVEHLLQAAEERRLRRKAARLARLAASHARRAPPEDGDGAESLRQRVASRLQEADAKRQQRLEAEMQVGHGTPSSG